MKKTVWLSLAVLLSLSAGAQALDIEMGCGSIQVSMVHVTMGDGGLIPTPCMQPCLIPPVICNPYPVILPVCANPCLLPSPCLALLPYSCQNPSMTLMMLEMQAGLTPSLHNSSLAILMNMH
jgi:hypothetical protein